MLHSISKRNAHISPYLKYALRKFIVNMMSITEPDKNLSWTEDEPDVMEYHTDRAQELIQDWGLWFSGKILQTAHAAGKLIYIIPAGKMAFTLRKWIQCVGGDIAGFLDNNPTAMNVNFDRCRQLGYEMAAVESIKEAGNRFPVIFCYDGKVASLLTDQLTNMGLEYGKDFFPLTGRLHNSSIIPSNTGSLRNASAKYTISVKNIGLFSIVYYYHPERE